MAKKTVGGKTRKYSKANMDRYYDRVARGLPLKAKKEAPAAPKVSEGSKSLSAQQAAAQSASHPEHPTLFDGMVEKPAQNGTYSR